MQIKPGTLVEVQVVHNNGSGPAKTVSEFGKMIAITSNGRFVIQLFDRHNPFSMSNREFFAPEDVKPLEPSLTQDTQRRLMESLIRLIQEAECLQGKINSAVKMLT